MTTQKSVRSSLGVLQPLRAVDVVRGHTRDGSDTDGPTGYYL